MKLKIRNRKGVAFGLQHVAAMLIIIGVLMLFVFFVVGRFFDIRLMVADNEVGRNAINLGNALLSHPWLAKVEGEKVYRGVLTEENLDRMVDDNWYYPLSQFELGFLNIDEYPTYGYYFTVSDKEQTYNWVIPEREYNKLESTDTFENKRKTQPHLSTYSGQHDTFTFPVAIERDNGRINAGVLILEFGVRCSLDHNERCPEECAECFCGSPDVTCGVGRLCKNYASAYSCL